MTNEELKEKIESLSLQGYNEVSYNAGLLALAAYDTLVAENAGAVAFVCGTPGGGQVHSRAASQLGDKGLDKGASALNSVLIINI